MKKIQTIAKTISFTIVALLTISFANAQEKSAKYKEIISLLRSQGYTICEEQYANLKQGETAGHTRTFYSGVSYAIVACSDDDDVNDVDVFLNDTLGNNYDKDADVENVAVVSFNPSFTRQMRVNIKNYSSDTPYYSSRCRFVIGYK